MNTKRIAINAVFTAIALTIFMVELQIPPMVPIPGVKLGLANIVTVYAVFRLGAKDAACILLARILLGGMFSGQGMSMIYSMAGGFLCLLSMIFMRRHVNRKQMWVCSVMGAISHNIGQIAVAVLITGTMSLAAYLPVLMITGMTAGLCTGLCAQFAAERIETSFSGEQISGPF